VIARDHTAGVPTKAPSNLVPRRDGTGASEGPLGMVIFGIYPQQGVSTGTTGICLKTDGASKDQQEPWVRALRWNDQRLAQYISISIRVSRSCERFVRQRG